jgi:hypothetical protein
MEISIPDYSPDWSLRAFLISPRSFLLRIRFSTLERVGRVFLRLFTGTRLAVIISRNRSVTSALFLCWDLYFSETRIKAPSRVMRLRMRTVTISFWISFKHEDSSGYHRSSTRDSVLFTCCPPGPDDRLVLNSIS